MQKKNKNSLNKVEKSCQQIRQGHYFICTVHHRCLYKSSVGLPETEKYHILTVELYCPVRSFDENIYICDTCHKHRSRNYAIHVINTVLEMKCNVQQSSIK